MHHPGQFFVAKQLAPQTVVLLHEIVDVQLRLDLVEHLVAGVQETNKEGVEEEELAQSLRPFQLEGGFDEGKAVPRLPLWNNS